jgi:hypothetical protein
MELKQSKHVKAKATEFAVELATQSAAAALRCAAKLTLEHQSWTNNKSGNPEISQDCQGTR